MNPSFPNVNPAPFLIAPTPFGMLGRSAEPTLPPVGGYTDSDLERMRFQLMQSGVDPAMLGRIQQVIAMRGGQAPAASFDPGVQLLRPTPHKAHAVGWRRHNPFDVAADAMQPAQ